MGKRTCSIEGCERPHLARGWCKKHWRAWRYHGDPLAHRAKSRNGMTTAEMHAAATDEGRHCSWCGEFKPWDAFGKSKPSFQGRTAHCRACWAKYISPWNRRRENKDRRNEYLKCEEQIRHRRLYYVRYKYGEDAVSLEERRLAGDPCDVCGGNERVGIDHCHKGNGCRGLLCRKCNLAIGYVVDDPGRLEALAEYLRR